MRAGLPRHLPGTTAGSERSFPVPGVITVAGSGPMVTREVQAAVQRRRPVNTVVASSGYCAHFGLYECTAWMLYSTIADAA